MNPPDQTLTPAQWQGLARLGDLGNRLGDILDGPLSGVATEGLNRLGELAARRDLPKLAEQLFTTLDALERAGMLRLIQDNAEFVGNSIDTLLPILSQWMTELTRMPVDELKADLAAAFKTLRRVRLLGDFVDEHLAGALTSNVVHTSEFLQRNQTDQALIDMLVLLGRMHRNGTLSSLGDFSDYLAGLTEGTDPESLAGNMVQDAPHRRLEQLMRWVHSVESAMQEIEDDDAQLGGFSGLMHLLRDKEVQKGLHMLSILPTYLDRQRTKESRH